jgi:hypothetical protein
MRSLLDTEIKRRREGRGRRESPKRTPCTSFKVGPSKAARIRIRPLSRAGAKGAESGGKDRQIRRPFHPDCYISPYSQSG